MSRFIQRPARGPLGRSVSSVWWFAGEGGVGREVALPTGMSQLLVQLSDQSGVAFVRTEGVLLQGPTSRPSLLWCADQVLLAGVSFRAGGLRSLVGPAVCELADQDVPLEALFPRPVVERLRARLLAAPSPEACLDILEAELLAVSPWALDPRLSRALSGLSSGPVAAVARALGLSDRRLTLWFEEQVGLTPKRFARVRRFQRVLAPILEGAELGEVALACGYYDQAHMIRDFRAFAGVTPTEYRARRPLYPNHLPDVASVQAEPTSP
jgi:AraC-like DNA-binding protein